MEARIARLLRRPVEGVDVEAVGASGLAAARASRWDRACADAPDPAIADADTLGGLAAACGRQDFGVYDAVSGGRVAVGDTFAA